MSLTANVHWTDIGPMVRVHNGGTGTARATSIVHPGNTGIGISGPFVVDEIASNESVEWGLVLRKTRHRPVPDYFPVEVRWSDETGDHTKVYTLCSEAPE